MSTRINNGRNEYLYCSISDNASDYSETYSSYEECIKELRGEIIKDCVASGYDSKEIDKVISHYEIYINNNWQENN